MEIAMIGRWAAAAANQGIALAASLLMRSAIKPLLQLDERSLFAVGLSRADIVECLSTPFNTDPTEFLACRDKRPRSARGFRRAPATRMGRRT
jgi:uncharacterized protein YjiS (DUF1127 family)